MTNVDRYWMPGTYTDFIDTEVKQQSGSAYYFVHLPVKMFRYVDDTPNTQSQNIPILHWLKRNAKGKKFWVGSNNCRTLVFQDQKIAKDLTLWLDTEWKQKYDSRKYAESGNSIFWTKDEFMKLLNDSGIALISAKIPFELQSYDYDHREITEQVFAIWCWIEENAKGLIYRWDRTFFFEEEDDATLFKLTWSGSIPAKKK